ncbi:hypothetical protein GGR54DRAFT_651569 [Hypoxylon sp. NC1633]|nr:hypothetical protein GGR54DRAFT_651569 [Hypoxylon sp. NC1633]
MEGPPLIERVLWTRSNSEEIIKSLSESTKSRWDHLWQKMKPVTPPYVPTRPKYGKRRANIIQKAIKNIDTQLGSLIDALETKDQITVRICLVALEIFIDRLSQTRLENIGNVHPLEQFLMPRSLDEACACLVHFHGRLQDSAKKMSNSNNGQVQAHLSNDANLIEALLYEMLSWENPTQLQIPTKRLLQSAHDDPQDREAMSPPQVDHEDVPPGIGGSDALVLPPLRPQQQMLQQQQSLARSTEAITYMQQQKTKTQSHMHDGMPTNAQWMDTDNMTLAEFQGLLHNHQHPIAQQQPKNLPAVPRHPLPTGRNKSNSKKRGPSDIEHDSTPAVKIRIVVKPKKPEENEKSLEKEGEDGED